MKLIGISGLARSGKDSFYEKCIPFLESKGYQHKRFAFADALKEECDPFLKSNVGISAFTEDNNEKEIIRPLLVVYGTHIRRKMNKNCWIEKIEPRVKKSISDKTFSFITDVRFDNEIDWVHNLGGQTVHITRKGIVPPNEDELKNDPILKNKSKFLVEWGDFNEEKLESSNKVVLSIMNSIL